MPKPTQQDSWRKLALDAMALLEGYSMVSVEELQRRRDALAPAIGADDSTPGFFRLVQIAVTDTGHSLVITALGSDGSLWQRRRQHAEPHGRPYGPWEQLDVPRAPSAQPTPRPKPRGPF